MPGGKNQDAVVMKLRVATAILWYVSHIFSKIKRLGSYHNRGKKVAKDVMN